MPCLIKRITDSWERKRGNLLNELIYKVVLGDELRVGTCHCEDVIRDPLNQLFVSDSNYRSLNPSIYYQRSMRFPMLAYE